MRIGSFGVCALLAIQMASAQNAQPAAASPPPTEASVKRLFEVMHTTTLLDSYIAQLDQTMQASLREALKGQSLNTEQQQIIDDMRGEYMEMLRKEIEWSSIEPTLIEVYRRTFSAEEVDDIIRFYSSPSGQAVVTKLPVAMQQISQLMRQRVVELTPKLMQLQADTKAALERAAQRAKEAQATPPQASGPASTSPAGQPGSTPPPPPH
jgi:uncharacterized protein